MAKYLVLIYLGIVVVGALLEAGSQGPTKDGAWADLLGGIAGIIAIILTACCWVTG